MGETVEKISGPLSFELSQERQNNLINERFNRLGNCGCGWNNNCGCGNGCGC